MQGDKNRAIRERERERGGPTWWFAKLCPVTTVLLLLPCGTEA